MRTSQLSYYLAGSLHILLFLLLALWISIENVDGIYYIDQEFPFSSAGLALRFSLPSYLGPLQKLSLYFEIDIPDASGMVILLEMQNVTQVLTTYHNGQPTNCSVANIKAWWDDDATTLFGSSSTACGGSVTSKYRPEDPFRMHKWAPGTGPYQLIFFDGYGVGGTVKYIAVNLTQMPAQAPAITVNTAALWQYASSLTITGTDFHYNVSKNVLTLSSSSSSPTCIPTSVNIDVTPNQLICTPSGLALGPLNARLTINVPNGQQSSIAQVATIISAPTITPTTKIYAQSFTSLTIYGANFLDGAPALHSLKLYPSSGGVVPCNPTSATATQIECTGFGALPLGVLRATVSIPSAGTPTSSLTQVADIVPSPTIDPTYTYYPSNVNNITITGTNFNTDKSRISVNLFQETRGVFDCPVTYSNWTAIICSVTNLAVSELSAVVNANDGNSGNPVLIGQVFNASKPFVFPSDDTKLVTSTDSITIRGYGFSLTVSENSVQLSQSRSSPTCSVSLVIDSSALVCSGLAGLSVGPLYAKVIVNGKSSHSVGETGTKVGQVFHVPLVTSSTYAVAVNAKSLTIYGSNFQTADPSINAVALRQSGGGSPACTVTSATSTRLICTGLGGVVLGDLFASVTFYGSAPTEVQVATIVPAPTVQSSSVKYFSNAYEITIYGTHFAAVAARNVIALSQGGGPAPPTCVARQVSPDLTSLACWQVNGLRAGTLSASVTSNDGSSGAPVVIGTVLQAPVIALSSAPLSVTATQLVIQGSAFPEDAASVAVSLFQQEDPWARPRCGIASYSAAGENSMVICDLSGAKPGRISAVLSTDWGSSGSPVMVATMVEPPSIAVNRSKLATSAATVYISGHGFHSDAPSSEVQVSLSLEGTYPDCTVVEVAASHVVCNTSGLNGMVGDLYASIAAYRGSMGAPVQVASVVPAPSITPSDATIIATAPLLTISGANFAPNSQLNSVQLTLPGCSPTCAVTYATADSIVCYLAGIAPAATGDLLATVTSYGGPSAQAKVATVIKAPSITANTTVIPITFSSVTIVGSGFSSVIGENAVVLKQSSGNQTCTLTSASATQLVCSDLSGLVVGELYAKVFVRQGGSESFVQIATVAAGTCGLNQGSVATVPMFPSATCPMYNDGTCCTNDTYAVIAASLQKQAQIFGPTDSCCYERANSLLCGMRCDPIGSGFVRLVNVSDQNIATYEMFVCPEWCAESLDECQSKPYSDAATGASMSLKAHFATLNASSPGTAYCESMSTTMDASYQASPANPIFVVRSGRHPQTGQCFSGSRCSAPQVCAYDAGTVLHAPAYIDPVCPEEIRRADAHTCCSPERNAQIKSLLAGFLPKSGCCYERVQELLCSTSCSSTGSDYSTMTHFTSQTNTSVYNTYICEHTCSDAYDACKHLTTTDPSTGQVLTFAEYIDKIKGDNPPAAAFCGMFSTSWTETIGTTSSNKASRSVVVNVQVAQPPPLAAASTNANTNATATATATSSSSTRSSTSTASTSTASTASTTTTNNNDRFEQQCFASSSTCQAKDLAYSGCGMSPKTAPVPKLTGSDTIACPAYADNSCCSNAQEAELLSLFEDNLSWFSARFGGSDDCCSQYVAQIFCGRACSPDSLSFSSLIVAAAANNGTSSSSSSNSNSNKPAATYNYYVCSDYCKTVYSACKSREVKPGVTLEAFMRERNPEQPHKAMCEYLSSENDPTYTPDSTHPIIVAHMGIEPSRGVCFSGTAIDQCDDKYIGSANSLRSSSMLSSRAFLEIIVAVVVLFAASVF